jgi:hypothetical protein
LGAKTRPSNRKLLAVLAMSVVLVMLAILTFTTLPMSVSK